MNIANLAPALIQAQAQIASAVKHGDNPHFRSKYATLEAVIEAVKPALNLNGLAFVQVSHDAEKAAVIETMLIHKSGETLSCGRVSVPVSKADAQGYGSAMTYAKRYSLQTALGVPSEDDDGDAAAQAAPKASVKPAPAAKESSSISKQEYEKLDLSRQVALTEMAARPLELCEQGNYADAVNVIDGLGLDNDEKTAFWSHFASHHRSALKRANEAKRVAETA